MLSTAGMTTGMTTYSTTSPISLFTLIISIATGRRKHEKRTECKMRKDALRG